MQRMRQVVSYDATTRVTSNEKKALGKFSLCSICEDIFPTYMALEYHKRIYSHLSEDEDYYDEEEEEEEEDEEDEDEEERGEYEEGEDFSEDEEEDDKLI
ncbi:hypothetical protein Avbf_04556 [Armadillidium vulgare]|nr:hypothetical protein Avbf_04556 [Armadillidium vulgare]